MSEVIECTAVRQLPEMPPDRNGNHSTGYEVCFGDTENPDNWWVEYEDDDGTLYYYR